MSIQIAKRRSKTARPIWRLSMTAGGDALAGLPEPVRRWASATGFKGQPGDVLLVPAPDGSAGAPTLKAIFIRAPRITRVGKGVDVLARFRGEPVALRQGKLLALAFHPELTDDPRVHAWFLREFVGAAEIRA